MKLFGFFITVLLLAAVSFFGVWYLSYEPESVEINGECNVELSPVKSLPSKDESDAVYLAVDVKVTGKCEAPYEFDYEKVHQGKTEKEVVSFDKREFSTIIGPVKNKEVSSLGDSEKVVEDRDTSCGNINSDNIKIVIDPDYKERVALEKSFIPSLPLTPFDSFIVELDSCEDQEYEGEIITTSDSGEEIRIISQGKFNQVDSGAYQWKVRKMYPSSEILEKIVDSVTDNRKIVMKVLDESGEVVGSKDIRISSCVPIRGSGGNRVVMMRGSSSGFDSEDLIFASEENIEEGFLTIDPFKSRENKFSYYADLIIHDDSEGFEDMEHPSSLSSCNSEIDDAKAYYFYNTINHEATEDGKGARAFFWPGTRSVYLPPQASPVVVVHESGHALCGLQDEYQAYLNLPPNQKNCVLNPEKDYSHEGVLYGETDLRGCLVRDDASKDKSNRPSQTSLMKRLDAPQFNVVSCGYCLASIDGGKAQDYWAECQAMDTI